jgi:hypothetical protein
VSPSSRKSIARTRIVCASDFTPLAQHGESFVAARRLEHQFRSVSPSRRFARAHFIAIPPSSARLCTLTRAFLQVLCATRSCSAKKQFDNQKQLKGSARARAREQQAATWKRSKRMFYVYEYATGDTARCFQEERDRGA